MSRNEAEKKIYQALYTPTQFDFVQVPLAAAIEYLKQLHGIEIQLDRYELEYEGIGTHTPITRSLKGITLRSALRLMLRELDLTYVVEDDVLLITTQAAARKKLKPRVYTNPRPMPPPIRIRSTQATPGFAPSYWRGTPAPRGILGLYPYPVARTPYLSR